MKIYQLLSGLGLPVSNEENQFIEHFKEPVKLSSLNERDLWIAQNLVRKGGYSIDKDNLTLIKKIK